MPRYDFRCTACNLTFEAHLPFHTEELPPCPQCHGKRTERLIAPPSGIHFRGSGFYKTDSRPVEKTPPSSEKSQTPATSQEKTTTPSKGSDTPAKCPSPAPSPNGRGNIARESPQQDKKGV